MLNLDLRQITIEELNEPCNSFDLITMVDLIEHVVDLQSFMDKVNYLLKPGGMVFVQTPNFGCYSKWGDKCRFLKTSLEHLLYFEPTTLDALFASHNMLPKLKTTCLRTMPCDIDEYLKLCKRPNILRRIARRIPYIDYVRYLRSKLHKNQYLYDFDETSKEGSTIFAIYQKLGSTE